MKKFDLYTLKLKRRKENLQGIVLENGNEWVLLQEIPIDYVLDGYLLVRKTYIESYDRNKKEVFKEEVIKANNKIDEPNISLSLDEVNNPFVVLEKNKIVIQIDLHDDTVTYLGLITKIFDKSFRIQALLPSGRYGNEESYITSKIRTIRFENDYVNSLTVYNQHIQPNTLTGTN